MSELQEVEVWVWVWVRVRVRVRPRSGLKHPLKIYYKTGRQRRCAQQDNRRFTGSRLSQAPEAFQGSREGWGSEVEAGSEAASVEASFRRRKRVAPPPQLTPCQGKVDAVCMSIPGLSTPAVPPHPHPLPPTRRRGSGAPSRGTGRTRPTALTPLFGFRLKLTEHPA